MKNRRNPATGIDARNKQALTSLFSVLGVGLSVLLARTASQRSGPTPDDSRDMKAISQAARPGGPEAVAGVQVESDVGREAKAIMQEDQRTEEEYERARQGFDLNRLESAATLGTPKSIGEALQKVDQIHRATIRHTQGRDALFTKMSKAVGDTAAFEAKVGTLRKDHLALLGDERKI